MVRLKKFKSAKFIALCTVLLLLIAFISGCVTSPLHNALTKGDVESARSLIAEKKGINVKDKLGRTPLMLAIAKGQEGIVEDLLRAGADVNAETNSGWTPLNYVGWYGHIKIAKLLIERDADLNAKTNLGWTPLMTAVSKGHTKVAEMLIEGGAKLYIREKSADQIYATAKSFRLVAEYNEKTGDREKAVENYTVAAGYFEKASQELTKKSQEYGKKKNRLETGEVVSSLLGAVAAIADLAAMQRGERTQYRGYVPEVNKSDRIAELAKLEKEYAGKSKTSHKSSLECYEIVKRYEKYRVSKLSTAEKRLRMRVKVAKASIRLKPEPESVVISQVASGIVLDSEGKVGEWYKVTLPPDESGFIISGYIHQDVVEVLEQV